jgi:hypothetical protein
MKKKIIVIEPSKITNANKVKIIHSFSVSPDFHKERKVYNGRINTDNIAPEYMRNNVPESKYMISNGEKVFMP